MGNLGLKAMPTVNDADVSYNQLEYKICFYMSYDLFKYRVVFVTCLRSFQAFTTQQAEKFAALVKNEQALLEKAVVYALLNDMADTAVYIDFIRDDAGKGPIILFPGTEKPRKMLYIVFGSKVDTDKELEYGDLENAANDGRYNFNDLSDLATKFNLKKRMQIRTFLKE
ncbi:hypothetical protein DPMN_172671 [Dreissena polymorpha]|uniref:Uncharacterized protein n=1 Tax=Dreissena polymorpha TaxID=45954 RepID=A0A9D4E2S7_DREPO|nr:hypothetical protein DPMN_172671 [Dreissena polymorpha]